MGARGHIYTDSRNLLFRHTVKWGAIKQRWLAQLLFNFQIHHRASTQNIEADYLLSRHPIDGPDENDDDEDGNVPLHNIQVTNKSAELGVIDFR